ncbi:NERD domain-containing protein [Psychrobacter sp. GP33]|uniref:NERD domain-containing protein n=1 Tax=Psychrobacter sp. GP33 TaxID=2758709 RepID=UPI0015FC1ABF|nr:NERD domain-containing protein [Psychrobacter sp. GP33]
MLEIRRGLSVRSYENTFFREFAQNLSMLFDRYGLEGILIGNSICVQSENLQIDGLLVANNTVCIIDFKNFGGAITLPNHKDFADSVWTNESGDLIKGGSHINPYKQLTQQKRAMIWVHHNSPLKEAIQAHGDLLNPSHAKRIVCFQHPIELIGSIPRKDELDFFITDKNGYLEVIKDILDVTDDEVNLSGKSFEIFKDVFKADSFQLNEAYSEDVVVVDTTPDVVNEPKITTRPKFDIDFGVAERIGSNSLYADQEAALQYIKQFLEDDDEKVFILQAASQSGKSYLIPHIKDMAFRHGFLQVELLATSYKVIKNLLHDNSDFSSMYGYIYGGSSQFVEEYDGKKGDKSDVIDVVEDDSGLDGFIEIIPIKSCDDEDKTLYIVDEAHLLSNSFVQPLIKQFGTGRVLADFLTFMNLGESKRKVIFIGDQYHMIMGKKDENALNTLFYTSHLKLKNESKVFSLTPKQGNDITAQARYLVDDIDKKRFNNLSFDYGDNFTLLDRSDTPKLIADNLKNDFKILNYTNKSCSAVNLWIKKTLLKNGIILTTDDLVLINNNVNALSVDDTINPAKRIFNGDFAWVVDTGESTTHVVERKNKEPITLFFKDLTLKLCDSGETVETCYLENYLAEDLSEDEKLAIKILINQKLNILLKSYPFEGSQAEMEVMASKAYQDQLGIIETLKVRLENGEKVITKLKQEEATLKRIVKKAAKYHKRDSMRMVRHDTSSDYFKLSNSLHLRYGWCITVNKAMSYRWDSILLDAKPANRGTMNDAYFRWLYSGITRANRKVNIVNIENISPFDKIVIEDKPNNKIPSYLVLDSTIDKGLPSQHGFEQNEFTSITVQIFDHVNTLIGTHGLTVKSIRHNNYQEAYELTDGASSTLVNFSYKKNGNVQVKPASGSNNDLNSKVVGMFASAKGLENFEFVTPEWKAGCYESINDALNGKGYSIQWINEDKYKDTMKISGAGSYLLVELNYNNIGTFSKVVMTAYSDEAIKSTFVDVLESFMPKGSDDNG